MTMKKQLVSSQFPLQLLSRIEDAGLNASATSQQLLIDGWLLRFSKGAAKRSRCINAIAAGLMPLSDRIALCEPVYEGAGLPMLMRITPFSEPSGLDDALDMLGWRRFDDTRVMVLTDLTAVEPPDLPLEWRIEPVDQETFAVQFGRMRSLTPTQCAAHAQRLTDAPVPHNAVVVRQEGEVVACGQIAIHMHIVGLYDICTAPSERGRGLGKSLCQHLLRQAHELGAHCAYLQVDAENTTARALYQKLGFADAYAYHYRTNEAEV